MVEKDPSSLTVVAKAMPVKKLRWTGSSWFQEDASLRRATIHGGQQPVFSQLKVSPWHIFTEATRGGSLTDTHSLFLTADKYQRTQIIYLIPYTLNPGT